MRTLRLVAVPALGLGLLAGSLLMGAATAGASEPPPVIVHSPNGKHLTVGESFTFKASARYASVALWEVSSDGGSSWDSTVSNGVDTLSTKGILRTTYTFGPFTASESGWELRALFANDEGSGTGTIGMLQFTGTEGAVVTIKAH